MRHGAEKLIAGLMMMFVTTLVVAAAADLTNCDQWCGNVKIEYPFGMKKGCYLNEKFLITCNKTYNPPKPFLRNSNIDITNISIAHGELHIMQFVAKDCYTRNGSNKSNTASLHISHDFTISDSENMFVAIGCNTYAFINGNLEGEDYKSGCMALCVNNSSHIEDGKCLGLGCCKLDIPKGLSDLELSVKSFNNHSDVLQYNPCGYAFLIQKHNFNFSSKYIQNFTQDEVPLVLDWSIKETNCSTARNKTNCSICGKNAEKINLVVKNGSEYRCRCSDGYKGNPYLPHGCEDINECENGNNKCKYKHLCVNQPVGNYTCLCPKNYKGDSRDGGEGCTPNIISFIQIIIGISVGFIILVVGAIWIYLGYKKWKFIRQKEMFFKKNGGMMLQQHLSQWQSPDMLKIFTREELEKATDKYDESAVVGKGGYGTVYKGVLDNHLTVAIKRSKLVNQSQADQFINEVIVLSQINHRNVVKLIGCCLETRVPLLVYEFVANGTLFDHIHRKIKHTYLSWEARLKIASEIAGVLSYLHSSASTPIIHRDIKPTNILLDNDFTAKVSDFGTSKLVPMDRAQISTMVQGTLGYLDPEYLLTSELTEKSDVYSFGVVLLELITGKKAVSFEGPEAERNLAMYVLCAMKEDRLVEIVEKEIMSEANFEQIKEVAKLAMECVRVKGEERPCMKKVAMELEGLREMQGENNTFDGASNSTHLVINDMDNSINAEDLSYMEDGR